MAASFRPLWPVWDVHIPAVINCISILHLAFHLHRRCTRYLVIFRILLPRACSGVETEGWFVLLLILKLRVGSFAVGTRFDLTLGDTRAQMVTRLTSPAKP